MENNRPHHSKGVLSAQLGRAVRVRASRLVRVELALSQRQWWKLRRRCAWQPRKEAA